MKKSHTLCSVAFVAVFIVGIILGNRYTSADKDIKEHAHSLPEEFFLTRTQGGAPLERALLETLLENKKESVAAFQLVFTTAFPKNREVTLLAEREIAQSKKDIRLLETLLYEGYGIVPEGREETLPVEVPAPR